MSAHKQTVTHFQAKRDRDRETERDTQRENTHTHTERERDTERDRDRETDRKRDTETDRQRLDLYREMYHFFLQTVCSPSPSVWKYFPPWTTYYTAPPQASWRSWKKKRSSRELPPNKIKSLTMIHPSPYQSSLILMLVLCACVSVRLSVRPCEISGTECRIAVLLLWA